MSEGYKERKRAFVAGMVAGLVILGISIGITAMFVGLNPTIIYVNEPQPGHSLFSLSSWSYPDDYGQGIYSIGLYENSTGAWFSVGTNDYDETAVWEWTEGVGIKLRCYTWINSTQLGITTLQGAKNVQRHNVTVVNNGETVFSQGNFTFVNGAAGGEDGADWGDFELWLFSYDIVLGFLPEGSEYYAVTVTYELWW